MKIATRSLVLAVLAVFCLTLAPLTAVSAAPSQTTLSLKGVAYRSTGDFDFVGHVTVLGKIGVTQSGLTTTFTTVAGDRLVGTYDLSLGYHVIDPILSNGRFAGAGGRFYFFTSDSVEWGIEGFLTVGP
jgi:hypothetical protein